MQDAGLGSANKTIKRAIYTAVTLSGLAIWSYFSGIVTACSCAEGFVCDCTNYAVETVEIAGIVLMGIGIVLFVPSFFKGKPCIA